MKFIALLAALLLSPIAARAQVPPQNWTQNFIPSLKDWQAALLYKGQPFTAQFDAIAAQMVSINAQFGDVDAQIEDVKSNLTLKVDEQNGTSTGQTLKNPIITAAPAISVAGSQLLEVAPVGNTASTLSSVDIQGTAASSTNREFLVNLGFTSALAGTATNADKVVVYAGMNCNQGSGNCWAMNPLAAADAGFTGSVQTVEADLNNNSMDAPEGGPLRSALSANGSISNSAYLNTSGLFVGSVNQVPIWHDGILITNASVKDAGIRDDSGSETYGWWHTAERSSALVYDTGASPVALNLAGTYSASAINTQGAITNTAMIVGSNQAVCFNGSTFCVRSVGTEIYIGTATANIFSMDTSGNMTIKGTLTQSGSP